MALLVFTKLPWLSRMTGRPILLGNFARTDNRQFSPPKHPDMKSSRLIFALLLGSSVTVVQLAAQQTKPDQKSIEEVKAKAEAGDAKSQVEFGRCYDNGEG